MPRMLYNHMLRLKVERVQLSVYMGSQAHVRALASIVKEYGGKIRVYRVEEVSL
jgi:CRISPR/Cas system-associated endoribonuclease Cas2